MVISKIKPCMSKYLHLNAKPRIAHYNSPNLQVYDLSTRITLAILELIRALMPNFCWVQLLVQNHPTSVGFVNSG